MRSRKQSYAEVQGTLDSIYANAWQRKGGKQKLMINDRIADSVFQQVLMRADEYSVVGDFQFEMETICRMHARAQVGRTGHGTGLKHRRWIWRF